MSSGAFELDGLAFIQGEQQDLGNHQMKNAKCKMRNGKERGRTHVVVATTGAKDYRDIKDAKDHRLGPGAGRAK